jgi:hypothetical protein
VLPEEALLKKLPKVAGLPAASIKQISAPSPAQMEAICRSAGKLTPEVQDELDKLITTKVIGVKLVAPRAKGDEVRPEVAQGFLTELKKDEVVE